MFYSCRQTNSDVVRSFLVFTESPTVGSAIGIHTAEFRGLQTSETIGLYLLWFVYFCCFYLSLVMETELKYMETCPKEFILMYKLLSVVRTMLRKKNMLPTGAISLLSPHYFQYIFLIEGGRMIISGIPGIHVPVFKGVHRFEIV